MAMAKVVRVEEVMGGTPEPRHAEELLASQPSPSGSVSGDKLSNPETILSESQASVHGDGDGVEEDDENEEEDKVYPLPDNWPRIERLERPLSCSLNRSRMPCVRKAISHLELVQNIMDTWFQRVKGDGLARWSTQGSSLSSSGAEPRKLLRFREPSTAETLTITHRSSGKSSRLTSATLSVTGTGTESIGESSEDYVDVPYLGTEDVIEETIILLARLETDRQETQKRYQREAESSQSLESRIDELCLRRMKELPVLVQKEHEACITDTKELQWHLAYTTRSEGRMRQRRETALVNNKILQEEINFLRMHIPLVEEKLKIETTAMDRVKKAQVETDQELTTTLQRQEKTKKQSDEAHIKAVTERSHICKELNSAQGLLDRTHEELTSARTTFNEYVCEINNSEIKLKKYKEEYKALKVRKASLDLDAKTQGEAVRSQQKEFADAQYEYRELEADIVSGTAHLERMKSKNAGMLKDLEDRLMLLKTSYHKLSIDCRNLDSEIVDQEEKIEACQQQTANHQKNVERMKREQVNVEINLEVTGEELQKVASIHALLQSQSNDKLQKYQEAEQKVQAGINLLKEQRNEELTAQNVLQAKLAVETAELVKVRQESAKKKEKALKLNEDVQQALVLVVDKVESLEALKAKKEEQLTELQQNVDDLRQQYSSSRKEFEAKLSILVPHHNQLKEEADEVLQELLAMKNRSLEMRNKMEEMKSEEAMMKKVHGKTEAVVIIHEEALEKLQKKTDLINKIVRELKLQNKTLTDRLHDGDTQHAKWLVQRTKLIWENKGQLEKSLACNRELASQYRQQQNDFVTHKEKMLQSYDRQLLLETTLSHLKQLNSTQRKLFHALSEYHQLNGLFHELELERLRGTMTDGSWRVKNLKEDFEQAVLLITGFLGSDLGGMHVGSQRATDPTTPPPRVIPPPFL